MKIKDAAFYKLFCERKNEISENYYMHHVSQELGDLFVLLKII